MLCLVFCVKVSHICYEGYEGDCHVQSVFYHKDEPYIDVQCYNMGSKYIAKKSSYIHCFSLVFS